MKKLNARGFSHEIVLVLFVMIFAIGGVAYLVASHADSCTPVSGSVSDPTSGSASSSCPVSSPTSSSSSADTGTFTTEEDSTIPSTEGVAAIGIDVSNVAKTQEVKWYVGGTNASSLKYIKTTPDVDSLYQYDWNVTGLKWGTYRFYGKVISNSGAASLVTNSNGNKYLDVTLMPSNTGSVTGSFGALEPVQVPANQAAYNIGIYVTTPSSVKKVVFYNNSLKSSSIICNEPNTSLNTLYQCNWNLTSLKSGSYKIFALIYDTSGNIQLATNNDNGSYLDFSIVNN
jgi:hypothetical protein